MEPRYRAGDTLFVNPELMPFYGDDVVIHVKYKDRAICLIREVIQLEAIYDEDNDINLPSYGVLRSRYA